MSIGYTFKSFKSRSKRFMSGSTKLTNKDPISHVTFTSTMYKFDSFGLVSSLVKYVFQFTILFINICIYSCHTTNS